MSLYLDHAATSPVRRDVLDAMAPFLTTRFGNPSSAHAVGDAAARALEEARRGVARHLGMRPNDVIFTSGGTESNNLAIKGIAVAAALDRGARHVVTTTIEHSSILESVRHLRRVHGFEVTVLPVDGRGLVDPTAVGRALRTDTALVAIGAANNEVGTVQPVAHIRDVCRAAGVPLHVDAVQVAGWLPLSDAAAGERHSPLGDAVALSGHKIGAPAGSGVLAVRQRIPLEPLLHGGGQERGRRSGTESVAGAVALRAALDVAEAERESAASRVGEVRDAFVREVLARVEGAALTGHPTQRLPQIASFTVAGAGGESVLLDLERRGVIASSGSACSAASADPSHVLVALGIGDDLARTAIRFSLAASTPDLTPVAAALAEAVSAHVRADR